MKLYSYYRSSAAYRVRIALNYKRLEYETIPISLIDKEQFSLVFLQINPQARVPVLEDNGLIITQSMAILEYLEEKYPDFPLLPTSLEKRTLAREMANIIACDIHPLNNLSVLHFLKTHFDLSEEKKFMWYHHWIREGFNAIEHRLAGKTHFTVDNSPTFADVCLIPQVYNALRFSFDMSPYPKIQAIYDAANHFDYFIKAKPENQVERK